MKSYIIQIVGAALLSVFADILSPSGWKKYMGIITGIILLTVMITPAAKLNGIDIMSGYREAYEVTADGNILYSDMLKREFSKRIAIDVQERIRQEFSAEVSVAADVEVNDRGSIEKIISITISGENVNSKMADRISFIYDVDEVILNAVG